MKQTLRYDQYSCQLMVEGLPDVSVGQSSNAIGIITAWRLAWVGRPELEGRREHLCALMGAVLPYARHLISGVSRNFGEGDQPVTIGPGEGGDHRLELRSSQPDTPPLQICLDDAELADLVRVLDQLRMDPRLQLGLPVPIPEPLRPRELLDRIPLHRRLAAPVGGAAALVIAASLAVLQPPPAPAPGSAAPSSSSSSEASRSPGQKSARPATDGGTGTPATTEKP